MVRNAERASRTRVLNHSAKRVLNHEALRTMRALNHEACTESASAGFFGDA